MFIFSRITSNVHFSNVTFLEHVLHKKNGGLRILHKLSNDKEKKHHTHHHYYV